MGKIKNLLANGIYFRENKRTLIRLRTELREKWKEKRDHEGELVKRADFGDKSLKILERGWQNDE